MRGELEAGAERVERIEQPSDASPPGDLEMFVRYLMLIVGVLSPVGASDELSPQDIEGIRIYDYNFLHLDGPNAKSVVAYTAASVGFCNKITGSDNGSAGLLGQLGAKLKDRQPQITSALAAKGAEGFFGDSTGLVPLEPITVITKIKNVSETEFCNNYTTFMKRQAERYTRYCMISPDQQSYKCPTSTFKHQDPISR